MLRKGIERLELQLAEYKNAAQAPEVENGDFVKAKDGPPMLKVAKWPSSLLAIYLFICHRPFRFVVGSPKGDQ